jgi:hypothetical protein
VDTSEVSGPIPARSNDPTDAPVLTLRPLQPAPPEARRRVRPTPASQAPKLNKERIPVAKDKDLPRAPSRGADPVPDDIGPSVAMSFMMLVMVLLAIAGLGFLIYSYGPEFFGGMLNFFFADMSNEISRYVAQ